MKILYEYNHITLNKAINYVVRILWKYKNKHIILIMQCIIIITYLHSKINL